MKPRDVVRLSKLMSFALRHDPASLDLELDEAGWVTLDDLVNAIATQPRWHWIGIDHIKHVVASSDKQRFELKGPLIRARYGHSRAARPAYEPVEPPPILYHGTPRYNLAAIRRHGLKAMERQYVHLSTTPDMALQVGHRRDQKPALLKIEAAKAHQAGIVFGTPSGEADDVYLVDAVPRSFIEFPS